MKIRDPKYLVLLTDDQVIYLNEIIKGKGYNQTEKNRAQILLDADQHHGKIYKRAEIALRSRVDLSTVSTVRREFTEKGLEETVRFHRNANSDIANQKLTGADEAHIIHAACQDAPKGHSHWTLDLLLDYVQPRLSVSIGRDAIARTLKKHGYSLGKTNTI